MTQNIAINEPDRPLRRQMRQPRKGDLLAVIDQVEEKLTKIGSNWYDGIPGPHRATAHELAAPMLALLIKAGRR